MVFREIVRRLHEASAAGLSSAEPASIARPSALETASITLASYDGTRLTSDTPANAVRKAAHLIRAREPAGGVGAMAERRRPFLSDARALTSSIASRIVWEEMHAFVCCAIC